MGLWPTLGGYMKEFDLIETLKNEQELLVEKIAITRARCDYGSYKNLIVALRDITKLIHEEEFFKMRELYGKRNAACKE